MNAKRDDSLYHFIQPFSNITDLTVFARRYNPESIINLLSNFRLLQRLTLDLHLSAADVSIIICQYGGQLIHFDINVKYIYYSSWLIRVFEKLINLKKLKFTNCQIPSLFDVLSKLPLRELMLKYPRLINDNLFSSGFQN